MEQTNSTEAEVTKVSPQTINLEENEVSTEKKDGDEVVMASGEILDHSVSYKTPVHQPSQGYVSIPGRLTPGPLSTFGSLIGLKTIGHNYYRKLMKQYNSTVFRMHLFQPRIIVCDHQALECLFFPENVRKVPQFGSMIINRNIMHGNTPLMCNNPPEYEKKRNFFNQHMGILKPKSGCVLEVVAEEFFQLYNTSTTKDFEDRVGLMVCNITSRLLLGCTLDYAQVKVWFAHLLVPVFKENKTNDTPAVEACNVLAKQIEESPNGCTLVKEAEKCGLEGNMVVMELLYMSIFNMWGALHPLIVSGAIYRSTSITEDQLTTLKSESVPVLQGNPTTPAPLLNSFVMEVLRLHPPAHTIYGVATQQFIMHSQSGTFSVQKDELVSGSIYWVQRNEKVFEKPHTFQLDRFVQNPELEKFLYAFSSTDDSNHFHKCLGRHLAMQVLKVAFSVLVHCSIVPQRLPHWSGNLLMRLPASDKPFQVKSFHYTKLDSKEITKTNVVEEGDGCFPNGEPVSEKNSTPE